MSLSVIREMKRDIYGTLPYVFNRLFRPDSKKIAYYKYMKDHGYTHHPFSFAEKYLNMPVEIFYDDERNLKYILHKEARKLYFPSNLTDQKITNLYKSLCIEQDAESAHLYVRSIEEFRGKTILDIGSAEGMTSLEAVEVANFIYLFECQKEWIDALQATFEPWKHKVSIVSKFVSNKNTDTCITIDEFLKDKPKENLFLKMDIEGEERYALEGADKLFSANPGTQFAICIYHKKDDEKVISSFLDKYKCDYAQRKGYLYYKHRLRTCLLRGKTR